MIINVHNNYVTLSIESSSFFKKRTGIILKSDIKIEKAIEFFYSVDEYKNDSWVILQVSKNFSVDIKVGIINTYILVFDGGVVFFSVKDDDHIINLEYNKGKIIFHSNKDNN